MWMRWGVGPGGEGGIVVGDRRVGLGCGRDRRGVGRCWEGRVGRYLYVLEWGGGAHRDETAGK